MELRRSVSRNAPLSRPSSRLRRIYYLGARHGSDDRAITGASMRQISDWDGVDISFAPRDDESRNHPIKERWWTLAARADEARPTSSGASTAAISADLAGFLRAAAPAT